MGKNDLFVKLTYGQLSFKTLTQDNVGANASWDLHDQCGGELRVADIENNSLKLEVWDENSLRSNTLIGNTL